MLLSLFLSLLSAWPCLLGEEEGTGQDGTLAATNPALAPPPPVNQFTWDVYLARSPPPGDLPWPPRVRE